MAAAAGAPETVTETAAVVPDMEEPAAPEVEAPVEVPAAPEEAPEQTIEPETDSETE